jgi:hypothetical protein
MIGFKQWLQNEVGTSTASIATFARPIGIGTVSRTSPSLITVDDLEREKHEKHKKHKGHKKHAKRKSKVLDMFPGKNVVMGDIGYF